MADGKTFTMGTRRKQYLESIEQYKNTEYYEALLNNPYVFGEEDYKRNAWNAFQEDVFSDYSARENWAQEMLVNSNEYVANILAQKRADQHNSTAAQVARDQAAGLNPDLTGVSDAGQTQAPAMDENPPSSPEQYSPSEMFGSGGPLSSMTTNLLHSIGEFGMMFQQFRSAGLENDIKELGLFNSASTVINHADTMSEPYSNPQLKGKDGTLYEVMPDGRVIGPDGKEVKGTGSVDMNDPEFFDHMLDELDAVVVEPKSKNKDGLIAANKLFKSRRLRRFVKAIRDNYPSDSLERRSMREEAKERILNAHKGQAQAMGDTFYDPDPSKYANNIATWTENIDKKIQAAEKKLKEDLERSAAAQADYDEDYYAKNEQGEVIVAKADRESHVAEAALAQFSAICDSIVDEQISLWSEDLKKQGTWWSGFLRLALPQLRMGLKENYINDFMSKMSFGRTETTSSSRSGGVTTTTK